MKLTSWRGRKTHGHPNTSVPDCCGAGGGWLAGPWSAGRPSMGACSPAACSPAACSPLPRVVMPTMAL
eukprot:2627247-Alexandrium_andersonii.AAC.1